MDQCWRKKKKKKKWRRSYKRSEELMEEADLGSCFRWLQKKFLEQKDTHSCGMNNLWLGWKWSNERLRNSPGTFTAINGYLEQNVGMSSGLLSQCLQERLDKKGSQFFSSPGRHHFFTWSWSRFPAACPIAPSSLDWEFYCHIMHPWDQGYTMGELTLPWTPELLL